MPIRKKMDRTEFLDSIYSKIEDGMEVVKPKVISEILSITENGNIYYRVGIKNRKFVSKRELEQVFEVLNTKVVTTTEIRQITPTSKPCNATTIKWLLTRSKYVRIRSDGGFEKAW